MTGPREGAIEAELLLIVETLRALSSDVLPKLDPNAYSPTAVDPILFGGIVADLAVPYQKHIPGPSGTAAPLFHVLDAFTGRKAFDSDIGADAIRLREWGPAAVARFVTAVAEGPGTQTILVDGSRRLRGLVQTLIDAYSGPRGWLEAHRLKVYGFIEMSFKAGRPVTIGGFAGSFHERPWRTVHQALLDARAERELGTRSYAQTAVLAERGADGAQIRVVLDVTDQGIVYRAGDRLSLVPANSAEEVDRTLTMLRATGDEPIALTAPWRLALRRRDAGDRRSDVPLRELLTYARLRPLARSAARAIAGASRSPSLAAIVDARREDELALWEALALAAADGYDVAALLESVSSIVEPEIPRHYAIASAGGDGAAAQTIELAVEPVEYESHAGPEPGRRRGTASSFLADAAPLGTRLPVSVVRPPRFHPPRDPRTPIIALSDVAGLAGLAAIVAAHGGEARLLLAGDPEHAGAGWTTIAHAANGDGIARLIAGEADELRGQIAESQLYVSGAAAFVADALDALRELTSPEAVRRLVGERRVMFQVLPNHEPWRAPGLHGHALIDVSELVLHNDDERGRWLSIDGNVYDMGEFRHLHPGGGYILDASAGMDASEEYATVLHYLDPEINAMLEIYKVGALRRLAFGGDEGLGRLFGDWLRALFLIVEMQNAFENDLVFQRTETTCVEAADEPTGLKVVMFTKAHDRFFELYYRGLAGAGGSLAELGRRTTALHDASADGEWLETALVAASESNPAELARVPARLHALVDRARGGVDDPAVWAEARDAIDRVAACDRRFLAGMKSSVREGIALFEVHEAGARAHAADLLEILATLPEVVVSHRAELAELLS